MLIKQYLLLVKIANKNRNFWQKKKKEKDVSQSVEENSG